MIAHISDDGLDREESVAAHTEKTAYLCEKKGSRCGLSQLMSLCGVLHDMGKNKQKFDNYLRADEKTRRKLRGSVAHASTGAKYIYDMHHKDEGTIRIMVEMISYAIAAHHGLFDCADAAHEDLLSKRLFDVEDYEEACGQARTDYLDAYGFDRMFEEAAKEFWAVWNKIKALFSDLQPVLVSKNYADIRERLSVCRLFLLSCLQRLILSVLIDSDWEATSDFMEQVDTRSKLLKFHTREIFKKAGDHFEAYMREKRKSAENPRLSDQEKMILEARALLQDECRRFAKHPAGIYCLPVPTGGGKTLGSLAYAFEYCRLHPETERVIYVSPYISVTEQNAQVFREAIGNDEWILEHHSSVIFNEEAKSGEDRAGKWLKYDINWEEPFICTTFVQFMNTLFSDRRESARRMHRLVNAVVIIDEAQSMPSACIHTFNYMMNFLNAVCNTDVILCTATQPALAETECPIRYGEPKCMIRRAPEWFRKFERVRIHTPKKNQIYTFESLRDEIEREAEKYQSILVVLNTKSAVRKLYDLLKARHIHVKYLTTNLCAEHRRDRVRSIKEALEKKKEAIVVVSTNLIEAGVDLSFERAYRSMAGLDSLAQTAGRCNRNGETDCGDVSLIRLEGENAGNMKELRQNIRVTEHVLHEYGNGEREESLLMPGWMERYYKEAYSYASDKMNFPVEKLDTSILELLSRGFWLKERKNQMNQAYKTAGQAYRVIDDDSFGVLAPYKKGARIIEAIQAATDLSEIKKHVRQAQRYVVNVRGSQLKRYDGLIRPVSEKVPDFYMVSAPGAYQEEYGIAPEWETLIF